MLQKKQVTSLYQRNLAFKYRMDTKNKLVIMTLEQQLP